MLHAMQHSIPSYVQLTLKITFPILLMLVGKCFRSLVGITTCLSFSVFAVCFVTSKFVKLSLLKENTQK